MVVLPWSTWAMMAMLRIGVVMEVLLKKTGSGRDERLDLRRGQQAVGDQLARGDVGAAKEGARFGAVDAHALGIGCRHAATQAGQEAGGLVGRQAQLRRLGQQAVG